MNDALTSHLVWGGVPDGDSLLHIVGDLHQEGRFKMCNFVYGLDGVAPTVLTGTGGGHMPIVDDDRSGESHIRFLTPLECWRLMGFPDEAYRRAEAIGTCKTQLYRQAGNSIVVDCLMAIFDGMYRKGGWTRSYTLFDFSEGGAAVE